MRETQVLEVGNISRYLHVSYSTVSITSEQLKIFVRSNISDPRHVSISQFFETMFPNPFISLARYPRLPKIKESKFLPCLAALKSSKGRPAAVVEIKADIGHLVPLVVKRAGFLQASLTGLSSQ